MATDKTHHVTVRLTHGHAFVAEFTDLPGTPTILFDEPPPLGQGRAPTAAAVLGAAVGNCLAASFAFCLRKARIEPAELTAHVATHVVRDERGRFRIGGIDVEITPEFADQADAADRTMRGALRRFLHRHRQRASRDSRPCDAHETRGVAA